MNDLSSLQDTEKQNDQGEWFELKGWFTFLAENLGRLVEEKMEERVL